MSKCGKRIYFPLLLVPSISGGSIFKASLQAAKTGLPGDSGACALSGVYGSISRSDSLTLESGTNLTGVQSVGIFLALLHASANAPDACYLPLCSPSLSQQPHNRNYIPFRSNRSLISPPSPARPQRSVYTETESLSVKLHDKRRQ